MYFAEQNKRVYWPFLRLPPLLGFLFILVFKEFYEYFEFGSYCIFVEGGASNSWEISWVGNHGVDGGGRP